MSPEESEEGLSKLLGLFDVRGVPTIFDHFFPVTPPALAVRLEHGPDLGDHRLRGIHLLPRPPRHRPQLSEVAKVQERSVGDDRRGSGRRSSPDRRLRSRRSFRSISFTVSLRAQARTRYAEAEDERRLEPEKERQEGPSGRPEDRADGHEDQCGERRELGAHSREYPLQERVPVRECRGQRNALKRNSARPLSTATPPKPAASSLPAKSADLPGRKCPPGAPTLGAARPRCPCRRTRPPGAAPAAPPPAADPGGVPKARGAAWRRTRRPRKSRRGRATPSRPPGRRRRWCPSCAPAATRRAVGRPRR